MDFEKEVFSLRTLCFINGFYINFFMRNYKTKKDQVLVFYIVYVLIPPPKNLILTHLSSVFPSDKE